MGKDSAKSECLAVMTRIGLSNLHQKVADLHKGVALKSKSFKGLKPNAIMRQGVSLRTIKTIKCLRLQQYILRSYITILLVMIKHFKDSKANLALFTI